MNATAAGGGAGPVWAPSPAPEAARWLAQAADLLRALRDAPQTAEGVPAEALLGALWEHGLPPLAIPRRQGGAGAGLAAILPVIEAIAGECAPAALALGAILAGTIAVLRGGSEGQKAQLLGPLAAQGGGLCVLHGAEGITAERDGRRWRLRGAAPCPAAAAACAHLIVFAAAPADPTRLSAFVVTRAEAEIARGADGAVLRLVAQVGDDALFGAPGQAAPLLAQIAAAVGIIAAVQSIGIAIAAFAGATQAIPENPRASGTALRLADGAADIAAARLLVHAAAQACDAGEDASTQAAMARIAAEAASERALQQAMQRAGEHPPSDPQALQHLFRQRHLLRQHAGSADPDRALILAAIAASPAQATTEARLSMRQSGSNSRGQDAPDRVVEILDAAADAFTRQSYDATTLDQIGDVLGVTKGSIYYHYRSKIELFVAVYKRAMEMNIEAVTPIAQRPDAPPLDRLHAMAKMHSLLVMRHLSYQRVAVQGLELHLMGRATAEQRAKLQEIIGLRDAYEELFVAVIAEGVGAGDLPPLKPRLMVKPLFGAINWTTMWYQPRPNETAADRDAIATQLADFVVAGLAPRPDRASRDATEKPARPRRRGKA